MLFLLSSVFQSVLWHAQTDPHLRLLLNKSDAEFIIFGDLEIKMGFMYQGQTKLNLKWWLKINVLMHFQCY